MLQIINFTTAFSLFLHTDIHSDSKTPYTVFKLFILQYVTSPSLPREPEIFQGGKQINFEHVHNFLSAACSLQRLITLYARGLWPYRVIFHRTARNVLWLYLVVCHCTVRNVLWLYRVVCLCNARNVLWMYRMVCHCTARARDILWLHRMACHCTAWNILWLYRMVCHCTARNVLWLCGVVCHCPTRNVLWLYRVVCHWTAWFVTEQCCSSPKCAVFCQRTANYTEELQI